MDSVFATYLLRQWQKLPKVTITFFRKNNCVLSHQLGNIMIILLEIYRNQSKVEMLIEKFVMQVSGIQQTYTLFHHDNVPRVFSHQLPVAVFLGRILIGIPTILIVKFCSKAIAKLLLHILCNTLGIPIVSSCYVPTTMKGSDTKDKPENKQSVYLQKLMVIFPQKAYDVDTGIRFLQYAGLAWSVVDLVPSLFSYLNL